MIALLTKKLPTSGTTNMRLINGTKQIPLTKYLLKILPDFCWQTGFEVLTMVEADIAWENTTEKHVYMALMNLARNGYIMREEIRIERFSHGQKVIYQYKKRCA